MSKIRSVQDYKDFLKENRELLHKKRCKNRRSFSG